MIPSISYFTGPVIVFPSKYIDYAYIPPYYIILCESDKD